LRYKPLSTGQQEELNANKGSFENIKMPDDFLNIIVIFLSGNIISLFLGLIFRALQMMFYEKYQ
jgi:hypothetical protein